MGTQRSHPHSERLLKNCAHLQPHDPAPTAPGSQSSQPSTRADPAAAQAVPFTVDRQKQRQKMEVTWEVWHQKGQMSKEIINST